MAIPDFTRVPLEDLMSLAGRTAAVTGAGRGIGKAIAIRLAEAGANLVLGDLDRDSAAAAAAEVERDFGVRAAAAMVDVRDEASVEMLGDLATRAFGALDIWVNNAGIYPYAFLEDTSVELWDAVLEINLRGTFLGIKAAGRRMREKPVPGGVILNVASNAAIFGREGLGHYAASKHGVAGLTKTAARELGPHGIRVLAVAPTVVSTPGMDRRRAESDRADIGEMEDRIAASLPLRRIGVPDDVARVCLFCVCDLAAFVTGSMVLADAGGATAG